MRDFNSFSVGMAGLHLSLHNMLTLAERGLISPEDLDKALDGVTETLENLDSQLLATVMKSLDPQLANLKQVAAKNWKSGL